MNGESAQGQAHRRPKYLLVFLALAAVTAVEVFFASLFPALPQAPFLLGMSLLKALLVILYFMHLKFDSRWYALIFLVPFLLVVPVLITLQVR